MMSEITITLPDKNKIKVEKGSTVLDIAKKIGSGLAKAAIAGKVNGALADINSKISEDAGIEIITEKSKEAKEILRHSAAHVLAEAVISLFPDAKPTIGPPIEDGFYYDFHVKMPFTPGDIEKLEKKMEEIIKKDSKFERIVMKRKDAIAFCKKEGNKFKQEIIDDHKDEEISFYKSGAFTDLCRGPHIESAGKIGAIKLTKISGAYWRADEKRESLQRIYGVAFFTKKELDDYLKMIEESEKRDHRKLGQELDLFSVQDASGAGLVLWHPKGSIIRSIIEDFWKQEHRNRGYNYVYTPHIANLGLWKTSGHWEFYRESMYSPIKIDDVEYEVKPMSCPLHVLIYNSKKRSYRELPLRWNELGTVYRYERAGVLHGLTRVRGFTQDDAHIFCTTDQLESELIGVINLAKYMLETFGFREYNAYLSTRPQKSIGSDDIWGLATSALKGALEKSAMKYTVDAGEGVFYGPKIDIKLKDALGREWQCSTIQVDFNFPEKFDINYVGPDNKEHRVVMVHRALLGSIERFTGVLIEHYEGKFPLWLSPVQVKVIPVADRHRDYAEKILEKLRQAGLRAEPDYRQEKVEHKIRDAQLEKINYMIVVGDREIEKNTITSRTREGKVTFSVNPAEFINTLKTELESRR